ncbi:SIMPL domain-containing protein [Oceaniglobus roseus]|uniref:SIMPL domain-containing protein n=1 Tax=Oceaniglobus roseus TaxID=1737570 RepID=UPI000C7EC993|nr:SIMPL domain-containing protein [Kandeliimicrobium roseum]
MGSLGGLWRSLLIGAAVSAVLCTSGASAQETKGSRLVVTGEGSVSAPSDMAVLSLGVRAQARTAAEAMSAGGAQMQRVLDAIRGIGVAALDVRTTTLQLQPVYGQPPERGGASEIEGYEAASDLEVRVRDLGQVAKVIDGVTQAGGNSFSGIRFDIADPKPLQDRARVAAVEDGRAKAELYARAAGVPLGQLVELNDMGGGGGGPRPMYERAAMEAMPVAGGSLDITATVQMVYRLERPD